MVLLNVGLAVSPAMAAISALFSFSAAANAALKCCGSIFLNGGRPNAAPQRASSGFFGFMRAGAAERALATRAATLLRPALLDLAFPALLFTSMLLESALAAQISCRAVMQR